MQQLKYILYSFAGLLWVCSAYAQPNITRIEYYLDNDPGYGNAFGVSITPDTNIVNRVVSLNPNNIPAGLHVFGIRARDANGVWSLDNKWLFLKPYTTDTTRPNLNRIEYYVDTDPGYGNGINVSFTNGQEVSNAVVSIDPNTLSAGLHLMGIRSRDAKGVWSHDNKWLFLKPEAPASPEPDIVWIEYYIDSDPGFGRAIPIAIENAKEYPNFSLPVNISTLDTGKHIFFIRSRDRNGAWSLDNKYEFTIQPAIPAASIIVNSVSNKTICTGGTVDISFDAKGDFDSTNIFTVQLSNINGSFSNPRIIGSDTGRKSAIITCNIPSNITPGFGYRVRVVSTNVEVTGATGFDTLTVATPPAVPTVTANGPTTFCQGGNVRLTSSPATSYLWSTGDTTRSINVNRSGNYRVIITNPSGCTAVSAITTVTVNALPDATITASGATSDVCPGKTVTLTASAGTSYLWSNGATTQSIVVSAAGNYIVTVTNENGCSKASAPIAVTYQSCPQPTNLVVSNITATSARLSWSPPASSCVVGYQEQYRQVGTTEWITLQQVNPAKNITGLLPGTTYQWRVQTGCQQSPPIGSGNVSGTNFTTLTSTLPGIAGANPKLAGSGLFSAVIYPNPASNTAILSISGIVKDARITLSDATGKVLWTREHLAVNQLQLPAQQLAAGMYFVNVYSNGEFKVLKFVKE